VWCMCTVKCVYIIYHTLLCYSFGHHDFCIIHYSSQKINIGTDNRQYQFNRSSSISDEILKQGRVTPLLLPHFGNYSGVTFYVRAVC
jgi:hypothetical protein